MSNRDISPEILQKHISASGSRDSKQQQETAYADIERFRSNSLKFQSLTFSNNEQKMLVTLEVQSRTLPLFLRMLKAFVLLCRMYLLISPSLISNLKSFEGNEFIYHVNLIFSAIIFVKINLVLKKKRRQYFRSITQCADYISCLGLVLSSLIYTLTSHFIHARNSFQHYYFWSFCCFVNIFHIIDRLKQFRLISETFSIIMLAVKLNYPFFYVMLIVYCVFASLGSYIFGGCIHSDTPAQMDAVGHSINPLLVIHNWNDFFNSMVFLYSINLNNNLPAYINMSTVQDGKRSMVKLMFFFIFYTINNFILMNIFIGQIIEISLCYFKTIYNESKDVQMKKIDNYLNDSMPEYRVKV